MNEKTDISDASLVLAYQKGDKKALTLLVKRWHLLYCRLAFFYVKDADIAKDIAQECWIIIHKKRDSLKDPEKWKSWTISIVNRRSLDWLRKSNRERNKLHDFFKENSTSVSNDKEESDEQIKIREQLLMGISKLSLNQQEVIQLFYREGYSLKEISKIMSTTVSVTKSRLFHAREKLKTILKKKKYEE